MLLFSENGLNPEQWEIDECLYLIEEIQCKKLKHTIFSNLPYVNNKSVKQQIEEDVMKINYSLALCDVIDAIDKIIESQNKESK